MDVFLTTEALRTTECTEKNSEISVFSVVLSDSVVPKAGSHDLLPNPQPARRGFWFGGRLGAPAILGSVQGRQSAGMERAEALDIMAAALERCSGAAADWGVGFIYEPLNRYETNVFNQAEKAAEFLAERGLERVCLLADLFHMNIEERDIAAALRGAGRWVGHVHFADSNRQAMGFGHTDPVPVLAALREIGYQGYLSAEILPLPDPLTAARQTIESIRAALAACPE
jgi:sugar phosphate isomerase/epimerase